MLDSVYVTNCLVAGFSVSQIADSCGCTVSAVTQHIAAHNLQAKAGAQMQKHLTAATSIDDKLNAIEEKAWNQLEKQLSLLMDPMKLLRIAQVANAAKRRSLPQENAAPTGAPVTLQLPSHVTATFQFNARNEAVAIGERPLVTLPATEARKMLEVQNAQHDW